PGATCLGAHHFRAGAEVVHGRAIALGGELLPLLAIALLGGRGRRRALLTLAIPTLVVFDAPAPAGFLFLRRVLRALLGQSAALGRLSLELLARLALTPFAEVLDLEVELAHLEQLRQSVAGGGLRLGRRRRPRLRPRRRRRTGAPPARARALVPRYGHRTAELPPAAGACFHGLHPIRGSVQR